MTNEEIATLVRFTAWLGRMNSDLGEQVSNLLIHGYIGPGRFQKFEEEVIEEEGKG